MFARNLALILVLVAGTCTSAQELRSLDLRQDILGWEGVGRLELNGQGYCSGVLIDSETVLTAAHCLRDEAGGWREADGLRFRAGLTRGTAIAERDVIQAVVDPDYAPDEPDPRRKLRHDLALLRLASPIPAATARPFRVDALPRQGQVSAVSYGAGRDSALSREIACDVLNQGGGLAMMDCSSAPGSSGAPVFAIGQGRIRIVSMIVAGTVHEGRPVSIGITLDQIVPRLARGLRDGAGLWATVAPEARRMTPGGGRDTSGARFLRP